MLVRRAHMALGGAANNMLRCRQKRVLVTGGAGFIGRHLVRGLATAGFAVRILDNLSTGCRQAVPAIDCVDLVVGDVLDREAVRHAAKGADLVVHLAAIVGMRQVHSDPAHAFRVSDEGTANVLEATGNVPILLMSSSAVYGLRLSAHADETITPRWEDALRYDGRIRGYACGKQRLEELGRDAMARGRHVILLRPFNVVGPGQVGTYGMVLPRFVRQALAGEPLIIHGDGQQTRCFSDVRTFVDCTIRLLCLTEAWRPDQNPINVGTTTATKILDLAKLVLGATQSSSEIIFTPFSSIFPGMEDVKERRPHVDRLHKLLGSVSWRGIESIVREVMAAEEAETCFADGLQSEADEQCMVRHRQTETYDRSIMQIKN